MRRGGQGRQVKPVPVLIPVNALGRAKGRLSALLAPEERETLALITFETVLHAVGPAAIVLTPDKQVAALAGGRARVMAEDPKRKGLNEQLERAVAALLAETPECPALLILHADLPLATEGAIETLLAMREPGTATLVSSRDGGTNAMLLCPPGRFGLAYGPDSFAKQVAAAKAAAIEVHPNENRELRLDLDTPEDIRELLRAPRGRQGAAGRYLLSIGIEDRLAAS
jgi:2-phospho-L-lactate/phosphoenolpyruvate guanylyltransferase